MEELIKSVNIDENDTLSDNSQTQTVSEAQSSSDWESIDDFKSDRESTKDTDNDLSKDWEDVLGSGALMKKTIVNGKPDTQPKRQMICTINYVCTLENGDLVEKFENLKVQQGDLEVVQAIDLTLALMNVGEKCLLKVKPRLAYGSKGFPPNVMSNSVLHYKLELVDVEEENENYTITERKKIGNEKKMRGNWWYGRGEYTFAIQCYRRAMEYLDEAEGGITTPLPDNKEEITDSDLQGLLEDRLSVHNNLAAAQMKQGAHDAALNSLQNVLRCQPNNIKALYRKAVIYKEKNDVQEALRILQKAKSIEPDNNSILKEIKTLTGILQKQKNSEKELAKRMFCSKDKNDSKVKKKNSTSSFFWASLLGSVVVGVVGVTAWKFRFS